MTSAHDAPAVPPSSIRRPWTLQKRLILTVTAIVSLILVLVGVSTSAILGGVLESRLDAQVRSSLERMSVVVAQEVRNDPTVDAATILSRSPYDPGVLLAIETAEGVSVAVTTASGVRAFDDDQVEDFIAAVTEETTSPQSTRTLGLTDLGQFQVSGANVIGTTTVLGLSRSDIAGTIAQMLLVIALLTAGGLVLLSAATAWTIGRGLRPLHAVAGTATRVSELPLDHDTKIPERVPDELADPRTEIGQVGAALNTLLDHVSSSLSARQRNEERMRRFVADASHELRTPLASIRGYSELSLRALQRNPGDAEAVEGAEGSLERIQAQSLRMTRLVEDLLLLARLDEGHEIVFGTVDLTRLVMEAVGDARPAGPDHEWVLDVGDDPIVIAGDAGRLTQVVANLLANARTHTPAGTTVTVSLERDGTDAVLRVHDDGPGVDPVIADELFERFARADVSRARKTGGTGLGLSIVKAIVDSHHGRIDVDSAPGSTTFTVVLPARPRDPADDVAESELTLDEDQ